MSMAPDFSASTMPSYAALAASTLANRATSTALLPETPIAPSARMPSSSATTPSMIALPWSSAAPATTLVTSPSSAATTNPSTLPVVGSVTLSCLSVIRRTPWLPRVSDRQ